MKKTDLWEFKSFSLMFWSYNASRNFQIPNELYHNINLRYVIISLHWNILWW
jgi:hypothetical protein